MSDISSTIRLKDEFSAPLKQIMNNVDKLSDQLEKITGVTDPFNSMSNSLNNLFVAAGGYKVMELVGNAFKYSAAAAIEFESAITGVYKTVDGTADQLQSLSDAVRQMSHELPSSITEIAGVAEAAGQLGIATSNIEEFSRTMINLGNSTNLSADQAASALAKFANITGMSADAYSNLGSVIVDLGNHFATTEADIVNMSTYLTSAASVAGFAETDILALSAAMSSVGITAEAGGSSMSKLISMMQTAVETGGESLQAFASVAGMTGDQFKRTFGSDAVGALQAFVSGLNDVERNGKSMSAVLQDMSLDDIRMSNVLKALASGSDVLTSAVSTANKAWQNNTALTTEANKRYDTLDSKMQMLSNSADDLQIAIGESLTPAVGKFVDFSTNALNCLTDWSRENQRMTASIMGAVSAVGYAVGGFNTLAPAITAVSTAAKAMNVALSMDAITLALGGIAAVGALVGYAFSDAEEQVESYAGTLEQCSNEIESARLAHATAVEMYGAESDAALRLSGQIETLNAQYEKGGGIVSDYTQRINEVGRQIQQMNSEYESQMQAIGDDESFAITAIAQLEELRDKANKTNPDLELMSKYADYLNDRFECDIIVNYNTGDLTGFDPVDAAAQAEREKLQSEREAAWNHINSDDFKSTYKRAYEDAVGKRKAFEQEKKYWDKFIRDQSKLENTALYGLYDDNGRLKDEFKPKYAGESYDYLAISDYLKQNDYVIPNDQLSWWEKNFTSKTFSDKFVESVTKLEESQQQYKGLIDDINKSMKTWGTPDAAAGFAAGLIDEQPVNPFVNSAWDASVYKKAIEKRLGIEKTELSLLGEAWRDVMMDGSMTEQEMISLVTKLPDEAQAPLQEFTDMVTALTDEYNKACDAAYDSFSKQFGLFDNASESYKKTCDDIVSSNESIIQSYIDSRNAETEYFNTLQSSIDTLSSTAASQIGVSEQVWDDFKDYAEQLPATMGEQGAAAVNAFAEAINSGENGIVKEAVKAHQDNENAMKGLSQDIVRESSDIEQKLQDAYDKSRQSILELKGLEGAAYSAATSMMDSYIAALSLGGDRAISKMAEIAQQVTAAMNGINSTVNTASSVTVKGGKTSSSSVAIPGLASGTRSAMPGLTLVGEEGPELVTFRGGESVYNALETKRIMEKMQHMGDTSVYIPSSIHEALGLEHSIGGLNDYNYYTTSIPDNDLKLSESDRDFLVSLGEREALNAATATTQNINFEMKDFTIKNESDLDGVVDYLAKGLQEALVTSAERVHK